MVFPDFNNNGKPDYQEPWAWLLMGKGVASIVVLFAAKHTVAYKLARWYLDEGWKRNLSAVK